MMQLMAVVPAELLRVVQAIHSAGTLDDMTRRRLRNVLESMKTGPRNSDDYVPPPAPRTA